MIWRNCPSCPWYPGPIGAITWPRSAWNNCWPRTGSIPAQPADGVDLLRGRCPRPVSTPKPTIACMAPRGHAPPWSPAGGSSTPDNAAVHHAAVRASGDNSGDCVRRGLVRSRLARGDGCGCGRRRARLRFVRRRRRLFVDGVSPDWRQVPRRHPPSARPAWRLLGSGLRSVLRTGRATE